MRIRKFQADTMREALLQVKEEMGPEALILRTQKIKGALLGGKERWEVTAGLEDKFFATPGPSTEPAPAAYGPGARPANLAPPPRPTSRLSSEATAITRDEFRALQDGLESVRRATEAPTQAIVAMRDEVGQLRSVVSILAEHWKDQSGVALPSVLLPLYQRLLASDVAEDLAREVCEEASRRLAEDRREDPAWARLTLSRALCERISCQPLRYTRTNKRSAVIFAGPTGVGKTTTLMKLAVRLSRQDGLSVAMIGCDSYRIGANEQIRTFAEVAGIPLRTVFTDADLEQALQAFAEHDIILVDTAGRSPANQVHFLELSALVDKIRPIDLVLVQSATTRLRDLSGSVAAYRDLGPTRLVFTKLDETESHGALFTLAAREKIPVSALCFGQEIPEHMADASPQELSQMVLGGEEENVPAT